MRALFYFCLLSCFIPAWSSGTPRKPTETDRKGMPKTIRDAFAFCLYYHFYSGMIIRGTPEKPAETDWKGTPKTIRDGRRVQGTRRRSKPRWCTSFGGPSVSTSNPSKPGSKTANYRRGASHTDLGGQEVKQKTMIFSFFWRGTADGNKTPKERSLARIPKKP